MLELEKLYKQKEEALQAGNINLYLYLDGRFTERFVDKFVTKKIGTLVDAQKAEADEKPCDFEIPEEFLLKEEKPASAVPRPSELSYADKILCVRKHNGWSQYEYADKIGYNQSCISHWERGKAVQRKAAREMIDKLYINTFLA